ncbi:MAG: hypothetical protein K9L68_10340 [Spirochaetales bacterium]|nr:hypothetical protein [Spirochaetales bacterium]MCF7938982.1 hypothetical protein [Spirochaetales bacterium]
MMMHRKHAAVGIIVLLFLFTHPAWAELTLQVTPTDVGGWHLEVGADGLAVQVPGSDYEGSYKSPLAAEYMDITGTTDSSDEWEVRVKRTDSLWDADLQLSARVTDSGNGNGTLNTDGAYHEIGETDSRFFSGSGERTGITIQFRIHGVSIADVAGDNYSTDITYTVVDTAEE